MSVTCSTSADLLQWNIALRHPSPQRTFERTLSHFGTVRMEAPIITNLTTLTVSRSLDISSHLPLISTISTDNVTTDLNGTVITCSGMSMGLPATDHDNVEVIILTGMMNIRSKINNGRYVHTHSINWNYSLYCNVQLQCQASLSNLERRISQLLWSGLVQTVCPTASALTQRWRSTTYTLGGIVLK